MHRLDTPHGSDPAETALEVIAAVAVYMAGVLFAIVTVPVDLALLLWPVLHVAIGFWVGRWWVLLLAGAAALLAFTDLTRSDSLPAWDAVVTVLVAAPFLAAGVVLRRLPPRARRVGTAAVAVGVVALTAALLVL
jgi:NAD(P)-dependent dehydrogenase (short-subunit alcohol dehydrogenase family)